MMPKWQLTSSALALQKPLMLREAGSLSASDALTEGLISPQRLRSLYGERGCPRLPWSQSSNPAKPWLDKLTLHSPGLMF